MLKSLVSKGVLSNAEYDSFMSSLNSVSSQMQRDFQGLSRSAFLTRYGHLRPGTYDILSPRYDEEPDRYFDFSQQVSSDVQTDKEFVLSLGQLRSIERLLDEHELDSDVLGFFDFIRASIEGREFSKFVFTRSLSDTLSLFKKLGAENGFTPEECSFADIRCIKSLYASSNNVKAALRDSIKQGQSRYDTTLRLRLPSVVFNPSDVWSFEVLPTEPNFITQKSVQGPVKFSVGDASQLNNSVVFIPSADPGFDWIFSHGVKALVTMYGGVNSHMAIRAGELGIPAVIGAGEQLFEQWSQASMLRIDCANRQVIKIK